MEFPAAPLVAYLGLGSNLAEPQTQILQARARLGSHAAIEELAFSSLYQSPPMGPQDQPNYINAVMAISTTLPALQLLDFLQHIENEQGRIRQAQRWVARTLDLDLLLYAAESINLPRLTVPHPGMLERAFVLYPLHEIAPNLIIPGKGSVAALVTQCPLQGLTRIVM